MSSPRTFPIHRQIFLFNPPRQRVNPDMAVSYALRGATYLYNKRIPYKFIPVFNSEYHPGAPLRLGEATTSARSASYKRFSFLVSPLNIVSLLKPCLPLLANTCLPTEDCKQPTWCVTFTHKPGNLSDHPWVSCDRRMFPGLLHPCSRRRSSCRKCYDSGAYRVQRNSTLATSTYASAPNSTRP